MKIVHCPTCSREIETPEPQVCAVQRVREDVVEVYYREVNVLHTCEVTQ